MSEFQREHRYWLIKRKHLNAEQDEQCRQLLGRLRYDGVPEVEGVVVESDWPIYDETWENVRRVAEGEPSIAEERDAAADYARDQAAVLELLAKALGVPDEPHQGRAERILEAAEGLAAHVERLTRAAYEVCNDSFSYGGTSRVVDAAGDLATGDRGKYPCSMTALAEAAISGPTTSLARRDAEKQRAAYLAGWQASGEGWNDEYPGDAHESERWIEERDEWIRGQAEGGDHE